jgi:hypothetical protein
MQKLLPKRTNNLLQETEFSLLKDSDEKLDVEVNHLCCRLRRDGRTATPQVLLLGLRSLWHQ